MPFCHTFYPYVKLTFSYSYFTVNYSVPIAFQLLSAVRLGRRSLDGDTVFIHRRLNPRGGAPGGASGDHCSCDVRCRPLALCCLQLMFKFQRCHSFSSRLLICLSERHEFTVTSDINYTPITPIIAKVLESLVLI